MKRMLDLSKFEKLKSPLGEPLINDPATNFSTSKEGLTRQGVKNYLTTNFPYEPISIDILNIAYMI